MSPRWLTAALLCLAGCRSQPPAAPPDAPNVLLVSLDTLRRDALPAYGYERPTSAVLSEVAAAGAIFTDAWSQSPATDGTHASMFTGRYQSEHGKFSHEQRLASSEHTLAEHFSDHGYRTFAIATSMKFVEESGLSQGFDDWKRIGGDKNTRSQRATDRLFAQLDSEDSRPWFGFLHYFDAHAPYAAPEPYRSQWHPGMAAIPPEETASYIRSFREKPEEVGLLKRAYLRDLYDGQISYLDVQLARLWERLRLPADRSTLVVITSDHGEAFMEHGYLGHGDYLYPEIMQVPLLIWWPGQIAPGTTIPTLSQTADLYPTLVALAGLPLPEGISGHSFASALRGGALPPADRHLILQSPRNWAIVQETPSGRLQLTVRMRSGKQALTRADDGSPVEDPAAQRQLYDTLSSYSFTDPKQRSLQRTDFSETELEALRELGYIE